MASSQDPIYSYQFKANESRNPDELEETQQETCEPDDRKIHRPVMKGNDPESINEKREHVKRIISNIAFVGDVLMKKVDQSHNPLYIDDIIRPLQRAQKEVESSILYSNWKDNEKYAGYTQQKPDPYTCPKRTRFN
jgi:hypothetical protein